MRVSGPDLIEVNGHAFAIDPARVDVLAKLALHTRHAGEDFREMLSHPLPISDRSASLHASNAVVVAKAQFIHDRQVNARPLDHREAVFFGQVRVDQWAFNDSLRIVFTPNRKAFRFFGGVSKNLNIAGHPYRFPHLAF